MNPLANFREDAARFRAAWDAVPRDARVRRALLVPLIALGVVVVMMRSYLLAQTGAYPLGFIPDARPVALFVVVAVLGAYASFGPTERRVHFLWFTVAAVLLFQLEYASVHWFTDYQGTIPGTRVDVIVVAGASLAVAGILALHADVAAERFAADHRERGGTREDADAARRGLTRAGSLRAFALAGAVTGLGALVAVAEVVLGDASVGSAYPALAVGAAILVGLAAFAILRVRERARDDGTADPRDAS